MKRHGTLSRGTHCPYICGRQEYEGGSGGLVADAKVVGDHCYKFGVCRLPSGVVDGIAEEGVECLHVAAIPSDLYGVADCPLHPRGGRGVLLGYGGVKDFCDGVDHLVVPDAHKDSCAKVLVSLDVRGNADLMDEIGRAHV